MESIAEKNAKESAGISDSKIYGQVLENLSQIIVKSSSDDQSLVDVGCGTGNLLKSIKSKYPYLKLSGIDLVNYTNLSDFVFLKQDFNESFDIPVNQFDITLCTEVIEHLENPRHFLRQLAKITKSGGTVVLTTPNPYSLLSLLSFALKGYHSSFGPKNYPAHITPVTSFDLSNMIKETHELELESIQFISNGRIPGTAKQWSDFSKIFSGKYFSDNYLAVIKKK